MVIMHFLVTNILSGAEKVALDILTALKSEHTVYYVSPDGPVRAFVEAAGVNFIAADTDDIEVIKRLCRQYKPDVVHAHDPRMSFKCALAGIQFISHLHSNCSWMRKINPNSVALAYVCRKASKVICVSESIQQEFIFKKTLASNSVVIRNAVNMENVLTKSEEKFEERFDLAFTGRFVPQKQPLLFVDLVNLVAKSIPDASAVMIGDGELLDETKAYAENLGVNITFTGFDDNPYRIMKNCRVFALTSSVEGFGLAAVEALILGLPVVCFGVGGLVDIVNDKCGHICADIDDMCIETCRLLTDGEYYDKKSVCASESARKFTDTDSYISQIMDIYGGGK